MQDAPLVSVVIPAYNASAYLAEAVESVLTQSHPRVEVIVVDDGSADNTRHVVGRFRDRVKYLHQVHQGAPEARNRGLQEAGGRLVAFLDADDYLLPDSLGLQAEILAARSRLGLVHSGWRMVDEKGLSIRDVQPWIEAPSLTLKNWLLWKPVFLGSMLFRREWLERVGKFSGQLSQTDDVDLVLRMALLGCRAGWNRRVTVCRRKHAGNLTLDGAQQARDLTAAIDRFYSLPGLPRHVRRMEARVKYFTHQWVIWNLYETGFVDLIPRQLRESLRYSPYPVGHAVFTWHTEFAKRLATAGRPHTEIRSFWPLFREASGLSEGEWTSLAPVLEWWTTVWWPYVRMEPELGRRELQRFHWPQARDAMKTVQLAIASGPFPLDLRVIRQYWTDLSNLGHLQGEHRDLVTSLYLTAFARSAFSREWILAAKALLAALFAGGHPKAWPAWLRFLRSGSRYALERGGLLRTLNSEFSAGSVRIVAREALPSRPGSVG